MIRKVHNIGRKKRNENYNELIIAARCLPALAISNCISGDIEEAFEVFADDVPQHDKMNELL